MPRSISLRLLTAVLPIFLLACSPTYDWREIRGTDASYVVMLPAKPSTHTRMVNLNGVKVNMTMTAARVNDITFAVGNAQLPNPKAAQAALNAMKTAMVKNIGGKIRTEKPVAGTSGPTAPIEVEAIGTTGKDANAQAQILFGRFVAKDNRVYQAIVLGPEQAIPPEAVETFFSSFKPN